MRKCNNKLHESLICFQIKKVPSLLLILIKHFWKEGLIYHNRSMLSIKIDQYIQDHIKEKILVTSLCQQFYMSKNALYHLFATEFNSTISEYILNARLQLSLKMIKETDKSITYIASDCGFTDYNYFIRTFKKQIGVTPLQFRKTNRR